MKLKLSTNIITQILATGFQVLNLVGGFIPSKYQVWIAAILAGIQSATAIIAHESNPDGTPATQGYVKPVEETDSKL